MPGVRLMSFRRLTLACLLILICLPTACTPGPAPAPSPAATPTPLPPVEPDLLLLSPAFRFEVTLRPAGASDEPPTIVSGQYRAGAFVQAARRGEDAAEELIVAADAADGAWHSYTRAAGETAWTRWPGVGFDAGFGLASPFSVLRLYPLADETARGEVASLPGVPEPTVKVQAVFSAATVARLLQAGASIVAADAETRSALETQLAPLLVPQTVMYWVTDSHRVYQAAATLLTVGSDGQPTPWLEVIWRFSGYDDPAIAVAAPIEFNDALAAAPDAQPAVAEQPLDAATTLRVRVFDNPGVPATVAAVTIYPASKTTPVDSREMADAQFALPAGLYDVQVRAEKAEQWLKGIEVVAGGVASQDVLFDFGALTLTVTQNGATPQVDIVIYPAGQRQTWSDWRTENPTTVRLPAGKYDVEVALPDYRGSKAIEGIDVPAGETVAVSVDLGQ